MARKMYDCAGCDELYDDKAEAEKCCGQSTKAVYICDTCEAGPYGSEEEAKTCCEGSMFVCDPAIPPTVGEREHVREITNANRRAMGWPVNGDEATTARPAPAGASEAGDEAR